MIAPDPAPLGPRPAASPRSEPARSAEREPRQRDEGDFETVLAGTGARDAAPEVGRKKPAEEPKPGAEAKSAPATPAPVPEVATPSAAAIPLPVPPAPLAPPVAAGSADPAEEGIENLGAIEAAPTAGQTVPVESKPVAASVVPTAPSAPAASKGTVAIADGTVPAAAPDSKLAAETAADLTPAAPAAEANVQRTAPAGEAAASGNKGPVLPSVAQAMAPEADMPAEAEAAREASDKRAEIAEARALEPRQAAPQTAGVPSAPAVPSAAPASAAVAGSPGLAFSHDAAPPAWHLSPDTGPAPVRSEAAAVAAPASQPVPQAVIGQLAVAIGRTSDRRVEIRLDPPELGRVQIHLTPLDGGLQAMVLSDRPETNDLLRRHAEMLARELNAAGYDSVSLDFAAGGETPARDAPPGMDWARTAMAAPEPAVAVAPATAPRRVVTGGLDIRL